MSKPSTRWQLKKKRQLIITEGGVTEQMKKESKKTKMVNALRNKPSVGAEKENEEQI